MHDQVFADGAQHRVKDRFRPSSWDTCCSLLQNAKGRAKWPLESAALEKTLANAMTRRANGAAAAASDTKKEDLASWERRGPKHGGSTKNTTAPAKRLAAAPSAPKNTNPVKRKRTSFPDSA